MKIAAVILLVFALVPRAQTPVGNPLNLPPTSGVLDYQLGGGYDALPDGTRFDIVVRDSTDSPLAGAYNICYINGFQTQPGELDRWLERPIDLVLRDDAGQPVRDPNWPDEFILDPATDAQRQGILQRMEPTFARCSEAGFDAIEVDNLDTYERFSQLDINGAMLLAHAYIDLAHRYGMPIAQKNASTLSEIAADYPDLTVPIPVFDFAVTEDCSVYDECAWFRKDYGDHVLQVEYPGDLEEAGLTFAEVCADPDRAPLTILRDRELSMPGSETYVYDRCGN